MWKVMRFGLFLSIVLFGITSGQDSGAADTVRVGYLYLGNSHIGDSVGVELYLYNDELIGGFSLGFRNYSEAFRFSSWSLDGSSVPADMRYAKQTLLEDDSNRFLIGWLDLNVNSPIPVVDGTHAVLVGTLYFILVSQCDFFYIDSVFVPPAGTFTLSAKNGSSITPRFLGEELLCLGIEEDVNSWRQTDLPRFELRQNIPNPFNMMTAIEFSIAFVTDVRIVVYDVLGREVAVIQEGRMAPGLYKATWDGRDKKGLQAASGVYFYRLTAGTEVTTRKMVLLK